MMISLPGTAFEFALIFGLLSAVLACARLSYETQWDYVGPEGMAHALVAAIPNGFLTFGFVFLNTWVTLYFDHPVLSFAGLWTTVLANIMIAFACGILCDFIMGSLSGALIMPLILAVVLAIIGGVHHIGTVNSQGDATKAVKFANVTVEKDDDLPDTDANHMVIVSEDFADYKAQQSLGSGEAGQIQANTYFKLGPATLEYVNGRMEYVFQLEFSSANKKHSVHNLAPGYIMVDAEDPNTEVVQRLGNDGPGRDYDMKISIGGGQYEDAVRYVYTHGYDQYQIKDPLIEVDDNGKPYISVTLNRNSIGWEYSRPVKFLLIDPATKKIQPYALNRVPNWVDRVYSSSDAVNMMNWWGHWKYSHYQANSNAKRYKVSGKPELVYTKAGYASWRMLMTSWSKSTSVNFIVLFDTRTNNVQLYKPAQPVGTEETVLHYFETTNAGSVKSSGYTADGLTLHEIYGEPTWVVNYVSKTDDGKASFIGVGLLDAYDPLGANVAYGTSKAAALIAYRTLLANGDNNSSPNEGGSKLTVKSTIAKRTETVEGGQSYVYLTLANDPTHVYRGTANTTSPALIFSQVGDPVTLTYASVGSDVYLITAFTDAKLPYSGH